MLIQEQLQTLAQLYQHGPVSDVTSRTLTKLLQYEAALCQQQLQQLYQDLVMFEQQYHLTSTEFYQRYQIGQMGDEMDFIEWASLVQMVNNLQRRGQILAQLKVL